MVSRLDMPVLSQSGQGTASLSTRMCRVPSQTGQSSGKKTLPTLPVPWHREQLCLVFAISITSSCSEQWLPPGAESVFSVTGWHTLHLLDENQDRASADADQRHTDQSHCQSYSRHRTPFSLLSVPPTYPIRSRASQLLVGKSRFRRPPWQRRHRRSSRRCCGGCRTPGGARSCR